LEISTKLLTDKSYKRSIVCLLFILLLANFIWFILSQLKRSNLIRKLKNCTFKLFLKLSRMEEEIKKQMQDAKASIHENKKTELKFKPELSNESVSITEL